MGYHGIAEFTAGSVDEAANFLSLCASFASELPGAGERQNQIALPQPQLSFFSAPQFTGPRRHALMLQIIFLFSLRSTSLRPR